MSESYSSATNGGYGDVKCYVSAWVESYTDKQAVVKVSGAVFGNASYGPWGFGVRNRVGIDGLGTQDATGWLNYGDWIANPTYTVTVNRDSGKWLHCWTSFWGETVDGYGPYPYNNSTAVDIYIEPQVLRPPSAPSGLAAQRSAAGVINLAWRNNASNASSRLIHRKPYGGDWVKIVDDGNVGTASYSDSVGTGTYRYRVQYWNADGLSGYSNESEWVTALCAPAAPSAVSPASGSTLSTAAGKPTLTWRHNSIDTSTQTAAQVRHTTDAWTTSTVKDVTTASSLVVDLAGNLDVQWQVRTQGAYTGDGNAENAWSPWSAVSMFRMRTPPSINVVIDPVVTSVPVLISWNYDDAMGTQASATIEVKDVYGNTVYTGLFTGTQKSATIEPAKLTPIHGKTYTVAVSATSTTSLQASDEASFSVEYIPPDKPLFTVMPDLDTHANIVRVNSGNSAIPTESMTVFRDGEAIAYGLRGGAEVIDRTPPLDMESVYRVVAYAASGSSAEAEQTTTMPSLGFACINFGDSISKMRRNLSCPDGIKGEKVLREVASSKYPKTFYGPHADRSHTMTGEVWAFTDATNDGERAMLSAWRELEGYNGNVSLRMPFGRAITATVNVEHASSAGMGNRATVRVDWAEVSE